MSSDPRKDAKERQAYQNFEAALAAFIQEEMPYEDNCGDAANDAAWDIARSNGPSLWVDIWTSAGKLAEAGKDA